MVELCEKVLFPAFAMALHPRQGQGGVAKALFPKGAVIDLTISME
jgi:hypothetical protein